MKEICYSCRKKLNPKWDLDKEKNVEMKNGVCEKCEQKNILIIITKELDAITYDYLKSFYTGEQLQKV